MNTPFVEGWNIVQTLGEGTFGEYVKIIYFLYTILTNSINIELGTFLDYYSLYE